DRSVVTGGEDAAVADDHGSDVLAIARGTRRDLARDVHEVFVPARARLAHPPSYRVRAVAPIQRADLRFFRGASCTMSSNFCAGAGAPTSFRIPCSCFLNARFADASSSSSRGG